MKKILFLVLLSFSLSGFTSAKFLHFENRLKPLLKNKLIAKSHNNAYPEGPDHPDFSGSWVGTCDYDPDDDDERIVIKNTDEFFEVDGTRFPIGGITTNNSAIDGENYNSVLHLNWSPNGTQLTGSGIGYLHVGSLSENEFTSYISSLNISLRDNQLHIKSTISAYVDGNYVQNLASYCIYKKESDNKI